MTDKKEKSAARLTVPESGSAFSRDPNKARGKIKHAKPQVTDKTDHTPQPMSARAWHCEVRIPSYTPEPASMTYALAEGYANYLTASLRQQLADKDAEIASLRDPNNFEHRHMTALRNAICETIPKPPALDTDGIFFRLGDDDLVAWPAKLKLRAEKAEAEVARLREALQEMRSHIILLRHVTALTILDTALAKEGE